MKFFEELLCKIKIINKHIVGTYDFESYVIK